MLKVLCSNALDAPLQELVPQFRRESGIAVEVSYRSTNQIGEDVRGGRTADLLIAGRSVIDELAQGGKADAASITDVAASAIGVCVKSGAPRPDIGTVDAFRRTLLAAKSVAHSRTGQSGSYFAQLIDRLGIGDAIRAKAKTQAGGIIGEIVARGEAELGIQQVSEVLAVPGVDLVGLLPAEIQKVTMFTAATGAGSQETGAARSFVTFLRGATARSVMKAKGLEPA